MSQLDPGHRCPDDEALAELFDGLLTPAEQEALYGRLRGCEACQEALAALGALVAEPPPPLPAGLGEPQQATLTTMEPLWARAVGDFDGDGRERVLVRDSERSYALLGESPCP